ncbi:hypothetical protein EP342_03970 [bacterium]|nr:MAG: hypothetical protein EP342_03970 [bacterium]
MVNAVSNIGSFSFNPKSEVATSEALSIAKIDLKDLQKNSFNKVFNRVDSFLDFGSTKNLDFSNFSKEEMNSFLKVMSSLMKKGIVGYEYYEVNGRIEKHFMTTSLGNRRLYGAEWKQREDSCGGWLV